MIGDERWLQWCVCARMCEEIVLWVEKVKLGMHPLENARQVLHVCWQCSIPHMYTVNDFTGVVT